MSRRDPAAPAERADAHGDVNDAASGDGISVVVPVYNEADSIDAFLARALPVLEALGMPFEIVFVDDGSRDETWRLIQERRASCGNINSIRLSRNFGKEIALAAGLDAAAQKAVVFIDVDLQDPPELIAEFVKLYRAGYQNVYGLRADRSSDSWAKRITAAWFYRLFNWLSDTRIPFNAGDFRLIGGDAVDAVRACRDRRRFMKGLYAWVGFASVGVPYERCPRAAGRSKFGAAKLLALAVDGVVSHSIVLLRVWTWVGLACAGAAAVLGMVLIGQYFLSARNPPSGFYLTILVILGVAGLQFVTLGIMGEYLGRIYAEVKDRPLYLLREDDPAGTDGLPERASGA